MYPPAQNDLMYHSAVSNNGNGLDFTRSDSYYQDSMLWPSQNTYPMLPNQTGFNSLSMSVPTITRVQNSFMNPPFVTMVPTRLYSPSSATIIGPNYSRPFIMPLASSSQLSAGSTAYVPSRKDTTPSRNLSCTLDIEKVRRHEDKRTTLMIRNIPNW